jgi:hypothetical protein
MHTMMTMGVGYCELSAFAKPMMMMQRRLSMRKAD